MFDDKTLQDRITSAPAINPMARRDAVTVMWGERNRLRAAAEQADAAYEEDKRDELDDRAFEIEEQIKLTGATSIAGLLAQVELLAIMAQVDGLEEIRTTIQNVIAGLQYLQARP